mmetsp:Transcript_55713/g.155272  ORF Transcript_55713/g.155272 Transcript_55713/m.155272 type:complete len:214 (-) Transcript_55713:295-936(-)
MTALHTPLSTAARNAGRTRRRPQCPTRCEWQGRSNRCERAPEATAASPKGRPNFSTALYPQSARRRCRQPSCRRKVTHHVEPDPQVHRVSDRRLGPSSSAGAPRCCPRRCSTRPLAVHIARRRQRRSLAPTSRRRHKSRSHTRPTELPQTSRQPPNVRLAPLAMAPCGHPGRRRSQRWRHRPLARLAQWSLGIAARTPAATRGKPGGAEARGM